MSSYFVLEDFLNNWFRKVVCDQDEVKGGPTAPRQQRFGEKFKVFYYLWG